MLPLSLIKSSNNTHSFHRVSEIITFYFWRLPGVPESRHWLSLRHGKSNLKDYAKFKIIHRAFISTPRCIVVAPALLERPPVFSHSPLHTWNTTFSAAKIRLRVAQKHTSCMVFIYSLNARWKDDKLYVETRQVSLVYRDRLPTVWHTAIA